MRRVNLVSQRGRSSLLTQQSSSGVRRALCGLQLSLRLEQRLLVEALVWEDLASELKAPLSPYLERYVLALGHR